jgi:hypothetical protein
MHAAMRALLYILIEVSMLAACRDIGPAAPKICSKAYAQCTMPSGVLGVCNVVDCKPGEAEPCLGCRSQH